MRLGVLILVTVLLASLLSSTGAQRQYPATATIRGENIWLRDTPAENATRLAYLQRGDQVRVMADATPADGDAFYPVEVVATGQAGWVRDLAIDPNSLTPVEDLPEVVVDEPTAVVTPAEETPERRRERDRRATEVPPTEVPPTAVPPTEISPTVVPPTEVPPTEIPPARNSVDERAPAPTRTPMPEPASGVTLANFTRIREGMSYEEVVLILGSRGEVITSRDVAGIKTVFYHWEGEGGSFGASLNAMFQNGRLIAKAQSGLE